MSSVIDTLLGIIGGVISGVILQLTAKWLAGGKPPEPTKRASIGDNSPGSTIDQSDRRHTEITHVENIYAQQGSASGSKDGSSASDEDTVGMMLMCGAGAAIAVLAFLFTWPVTVGFVVGMSVVVAYGACHTWWTTAETAGPRGQITLAAILTAVVSLVGGWWTVSGGPADKPGMSRIDDAIVAKHPSFDDSLGERWRVLVNDPFDLLSAADATYVLTLLAGLLFSLLATYLMAGEVLRWWSFRNVAMGRSTRRGPVKRANAFLQARSAGRWVGLAIAFAFVLGCSSGYAAQGLEWMSS